MVAKDNYSGEAGNKISIKLYTTIVNTDTYNLNKISSIYIFLIFIFHNLILI